MTPPPPPHDNQGPFVHNDKGPGLLRRLFGGGTNDPSSPHDHQADRSTSTMHDSPAMPTRRATTSAAPSTPPSVPSGRTTMAPYARPERDRSRRPLAFRIIGWIFRTFGLRFAIAAVAALLVLIGTIADQSDNMDRITGDLREISETFEARDAARAPTAVPVAGTTSGEVRATVEKIELDRIELRESNGRLHRWVIEDAELFGDVILVNNQRIRARWRLIDGEPTFVGFTRLQAQPRVPTPT